MAIFLPTYPRVTAEGYSLAMVTELGSAALPGDGEPPESAGASSPGADWEAVRRDYEQSALTGRQICEKHGVTEGALRWRIKKQFWAARNGVHAVDRHQIIKRMFRVLEQQVIQLERNMDSSQAGSTGDKEVAVLGKLVVTLEKLIEIDSATSSDTRPKQNKNIRDLRNQLAQRIEHLKRG